VEPNIDFIDTYVKATYPDMRKCINMVQMNSRDGVLHAPDKSDKDRQTIRLEMVELFKKGKILDARKLVCSQARPEEVEEIFVGCMTIWI
jgi:DNA polymerase III delta prime subunit